MIRWFRIWRGKYNAWRNRNKIPVFDWSTYEELSENVSKVDVKWVNPPRPNYEDLKLGAIIEYELDDSDYWTIDDVDKYD